MEMHNVKKCPARYVVQLVIYLHYIKYKQFKLKQKKTYIKIIDFDKSSDKNDKIESEAFTL